MMHCLLAASIAFTPLRISAPSRATVVRMNAEPESELPESFNFDDLSLFKCVLTSPGFLCTNSPFSRLHAITLTFATSLALAG